MADRAASKGCAVCEKVSLLEFVDAIYLAENAVCVKYGAMLRAVTRSFTAFLGRTATVGDLTEPTINGFLASRDGKVCPETIVNNRANLLRLWEYAAEIGYLPNRPNRRRVRRPKVSAKPPSAWTHAELAALLAAAAKIRGRCQLYGFLWSDFFVAFINLKYDIGVRLGDILAIGPGHIMGETVAITQHKTGQPVIHRIRRETLASIAKLLPESRDTVFALPHRREYFYARFRRLVKAAAVRPGGTKWLRRSSASYLERDNPGASRRHLGHKTGDMWKRYVDPTIAYDDPPLPPPIDPGDAA